MTISYYPYLSPVGELIIGDFHGQICLCDWKSREMRSTVDLRIQRKLNASFLKEETQAINLCISQLGEYFDRRREKFDIPLLLLGSDFQKKVWSELMNIPYGRTQTYLGLSKQMKNEKAIRAIASANGANALSILVPCHRVIGSNGDLVGYAGGLHAKKKLLELESALAEQTSLF